MDTSLGKILEEAGGWLEARSVEKGSSDDEQALSRFQVFLSSLSENDAPPKLEKACGLISRWIVDQCDWNGPTLLSISS
ncbi:MAG: hypothetical protein V4521_14500 [Pseudomonadota bacterium]